MARYTGPTTRLSRRFGQPLFGATKAYEKRPYAPGLLERQFRRTFEMAKRERGVTGERFLQLLETRLDSVVYLLGFAKSRAAARQIVNHGHVRVNGRKVDIASYSVRAGDEIEIKNAATSRQIATRNLEETRARTVPGWLTLNADAYKAVVNRLPAREEMEQGINEQLIVEFYSRF